MTNGGTGGDWRPIPDPTVLTTQQLVREVASLREIIETRLTGMDKAIVLLQSKSDRQPSIDEVVARFSEKFNAIKTQFLERDQRLSSESQSSTKQIDALGALLQANNKSTNDKIDDIKGRLTLLEGYGKGANELWGYLVGAAGVLIAVAAFIFKL